MNNYIPFSRNSESLESIQTHLMCTICKIIHVSGVAHTDKCTYVFSILCMYMYLSTYYQICLLNSSQLVVLAF